MEAANAPAGETVPEAAQWYRIGGAAAIVLGVGYVLIFPLYGYVGPPPSGGEAWFEYLPGKTTVWWAILGISVFTDFLYLPVAFALYLALRRFHRYLMQAAAGLMALFVVLDLAVTWPNYASILTLYQGYEAAGGRHRSGALAAADYASAVLSSPVEIVYSIVTLSCGILLTGVVMLRGSFGKVAAWLAIATGLLGILSLTGLAPVIIGNAVGATVWLLLIGQKLYRHGREDAGSFAPLSQP